MANKSVYQNFDIDALNYFGLVGSSLYGLLTNQNEIINVLGTQDVTTYEKINNILETPTETALTFGNRKKAFILPRCDVSQERLKLALKEHNITVTNDYEKADLIIGHNRISGSYEHSENIGSTFMLFKLWNYETTKRTNSSHPISNIIQNNDYPTIITTNITDRIKYYDLIIEDTLYDFWMISGMAINIAHKISNGSCGVVDPEIVLRASANKVTLDEDLLNLIISQMNSSNVDDRSIVSKILPTIDYEKNLYLIWKMAKDIGSTIDYSLKYDKDVKFWLSQSNFHKFRNMNAEDMILWLEKEKLLDSMSFKYLEPIVRREIRISNRDLYVFGVSVKKEYQKYLKN